MDYMEKTGKTDDQMAIATEPLRSETNASTSRSLESNGNEVSDRSQEPRFGFSGVGTSGGSVRKKKQKNHNSFLSNIKNLSTLSI